MANNVGAHQNLPDIYRTGWMSAALGAQRGGLHSKHQVEPLVGFGLGEQAHFDAIVQVASERRDPLGAGCPSPARSEDGRKPARPAPSCYPCPPRKGGGRLERASKEMHPIG